MEMDGTASALNQKLDMSLDDVVKLREQGEKRPRGGGRHRGGKRYSSRRDEVPYSRRPSSSSSSSPAAASFGSTSSARVYVGNLAWQTSWQDLKDHMRSAGTVVRADVFLDDNGRSKVRSSGMKLLDRMEI